MKKLVYVGRAGNGNGNLRSRLLDHLHGKGRQTAFRRKVFEHVLGEKEKPRTDRRYNRLLSESRVKITEAIAENFAFRCKKAAELEDFEIWLVKKYADQIWNRQKYSRKKVEDNGFPSMKSELLRTRLVRFSNLTRQLKDIPKKAGVYLIFKL